MCINDSPREVDDLDSYGAGGTQHIKGRTRGTQSRSALRIGQIELTRPKSKHNDYDRDSRSVKRSNELGTLILASPPRLAREIRQCPCCCSARKTSSDCSIPQRCWRH